jgi:hypothetical protein
MSDRPGLRERWRRLPWTRLRWAILGLGVVLLVVFLVAQHQSVQVSYGQSPTGAGEQVAEGSAGELSGAVLPSVAELTAMVDASPVVRLPGSVAQWDEQRVRAAIGTDDVRILVAPPGLSKDQQSALAKVKNADIRVAGTLVGASIYLVGSDDLDGWRTQLAVADVTSQLITAVAALRDEPAPDFDEVFPRRTPTPAELDPITTDIRAGRPHIAAGATLRRVPRAITTAFPGQTPVVVALPRQPFGVPVPEYGPALATLWPDRPILVMYGDWIEYSGPQAGEFAEVAAASFYARFDERISRYAYPQDNILGAYLDVVTDIRYAGLFERPLPYQPFDPLRVTLPVLPWLFGACVLVFLALSVRSVLGPAGRRGHGRQPPARLAALTTLAIEMSALSHDAALTRGIAGLRAARSALDDDLPDRHVRQLLAKAERDLDQAARKLGRPDYRPRDYLPGALA